MAQRSPVVAATELCFCNSSLQNATVTGFVQVHNPEKPAVPSTVNGKKANATANGNASTPIQQPQMYEYVIEVCWSGGERRYIRRSYADFLQFQTELLKSFKGKLDKGKHRFFSLTPEAAQRLTVANSRSTWSFFNRRKRIAEAANSAVPGKDATRDAAEELEAVLDGWLKHLLELPEEICNSSVVESFFEARDTDPVRASHRPTTIPPVPVSASPSSYPSSSALSSPSSSMIASSKGVDSSYSSLSEVPPGATMLNSSRLLGIASPSEPSSDFDDVLCDDEDVENDEDATNDYFFDEEMDEIVLQGSSCYASPPRTSGISSRSCGFDSAESDPENEISLAALQNSVSRAIHRRGNVSNTETVVGTPVNNNVNTVNNNNIAKTYTRSAANSSLFGDERFDYDSCLAELSSLMQKVNVQNANSSNHLTQVWLE